MFRSMLRRWLPVLAVSFVLAHAVNACSSDELNPQPLPPNDPDGRTDAPGAQQTGGSSNGSSSSSSSSSSGNVPTSPGDASDAGDDGAVDAAVDAGGDT